MKSRAIQFLTVALTLAATISLTACFGGSTSEPSRYYTIGVENITYPQSGDATPEGKRLMVRKFSIDPAYQRINIVYRESSYDFMFYDLDMWASRPELMLTKVATEYISRSKLFEISKTGTTAKPDFEILGHIDAMEEIDEDSDRYGHLSLSLTYRKTESDTPIFEHQYDEKIKLSGNEPKYVAEAISKLFAKYMEDFLQEVAK